MKWMNEMTETTIERLLRLDAASNAMGVRLRERSSTSTVLEQDVVPEFADHRGHVGLPMMSVLLDAALGAGAYVGASSEPLAVVANMSISIAHPMPNVATFVATGSSIFRDISSGTALSRAELHDPEGRILLTAKGRIAEVDRTLMDYSAAPHQTKFPSRKASVDSSASADDTLLRKLIDESASTGSLESAYGVEINSLHRGQASASFEPQAWMLNGFGSIQGGVLIGAMALITEFVGRTLTSAGQSYFLADIDVDLLRSPGVEDGHLVLRGSTVKRGRRLCLIDAELETRSGQLVARSHGTVILIQMP